MSWDKAKISEICSGIFDGPHATPPVSKDGAIFLGISNITPDGHLDLSNPKYINEADLPKWTKRVTPLEGDVVFSYEATLNLYAIIPPGFHGCLGRRMALIRPDEKKVLGKFLFYYFFSDEWRNTIAENTVIGATVDRIPLIRFPNFPVSYPSIEKQFKIVEVLSTYDDLIENNQKQIKLLEEAAQRLYKEWFVDLRFPGHETTAIVDGVPEGWKRCLLSDIIGYEIGGGWGEEKPNEKCDVPAYVIRGTDLYGIIHGDSLGIPYRYHEKRNLEARRLVDGDIVFEVSGGSKTEGVARTVLIHSSMLEQWGKAVICASFCKMIRAKEKIHAQLLFDTFRYMRASRKTTEYDKRSASSIVNYRWKDFLATEAVLIPDDVTMKRYNTISGNIYQLIVQKSITIDKAKDARNRLLPKLMSGEIEV